MHIPHLYFITGVSGYVAHSQRLVRNGKESEVTSDPPTAGEASDSTSGHTENDGQQTACRKPRVHKAYLVIKIKPTDRETAKRKCPHCGSNDLAFLKGKIRHIRSLNTGRAVTYLEVEVRRIRCKSCGKIHYEKLPFLTNPKARVTRAFEQHICELRRQMSISAVADLLEVDWDCVKNAEKRHLQHKYRTIDLSQTRMIGIDELYIFAREKSRRKYITVVRDMETGAVLNVSRGKGVNALRKFSTRLKRQKAKIDCVCMDMSNAYGKWAREQLPDATIVYDHFHLIKAMNDKLNNVRRRTYARIVADVRKCIRELNVANLAKEEVLTAVKEQEERVRKAKDTIKGNSDLLLMNAERLSSKRGAKTRLENMLKENAEISIAYVLKERLRSIYAECQTEDEAREMFIKWAQEAQSSGVGELKSMAAMVMKHLDGILGFWRFDGMSNARTEGFNGKIRWLLKQAYGYRDFKYLRLKILDLPNMDSKASDC